MEVTVYNKYHIFHYLASEESVGILYNLSFNLRVRNHSSYYKGQTNDCVYSAIIAVYSETHEERINTLNTKSVVTTEP
jgi:hypothetical protein